MLGLLVSAGVSLVVHSSAVLGTWLLIENVLILVCALVSMGNGVVSRQELESQLSALSAQNINLSRERDQIGQELVEAQKGKITRDEGSGKPVHAG